MYYTVPLALYHDVIFLILHLHFSAISFLAEAEVAVEVVVTPVAEAVSAVVAMVEAWAAVTAEAVEAATAVVAEEVAMLNHRHHLHQAEDMPEVAEEAEAWEVEATEARLEAAVMVVLAEVETMAEAQEAEVTAAAQVEAATVRHHPHHLVEDTLEVAEEVEVWEEEATAVLLAEAAMEVHL